MHANPSIDASWRFDHINVDVAAGGHALAFFRDVMGLHGGARPPFPFPGDWLYAGGQALVHAVDRDAGVDGLRLGHIAFRSDQAVDAVLERVRASGLPHSIARVPAEATVQLFVQLPGGLVIELDLPDPTPPHGAPAP